MRFRMLPAEPRIVEAVQWDGEQFVGPVPEWARAALLKPGGRGSVKRCGQDLRIDTGLGSSLIVSPGDWLVRAPDGKLDAWAHSEFVTTYEAVE